MTRFVPARAWHRAAAAVVSSVVIVTAASWANAQTAAPAPTASSPQTSGTLCNAHGTITGGGTALPGASIVIKDGARTVSVTSTDVDGTYALAAAPGTYAMRVELTPFDAIERSIALSGSPCAATIDVQMALTPRTVKSPAASDAPAPPVTQGFGAVPARRGSPPQPAMAAPPTAGTGRPPSGTRPAGAAAGFQSLFVQQSAEGSSAADSAAGGAQPDDPASRLLPPGFALGNGAAGSVQVSGSLMQIDLGQLSDRAGALARGDFSLAEGQGPFGGGRGSGGPGGGFGGPGGGFGGPGGGPMGPGFDGFAGMVGGANRTSYSATYQLGGSFLR